MVDLTTSKLAETNLLVQLRSKNLKFPDFSDYFKISLTESKIHRFFPDLEIFFIFQVFFSDRGNPDIIITCSKACIPGIIFSLTENLNKSPKGQQSLTWEPACPERFYFQQFTAGCSKQICSWAGNSKVNGQMWPEFELGDFTPVLVTC